MLVGIGWTSDRQLQNVFEKLVKYYAVGALVYSRHRCVIN